jgi:uncharacterized protein (TIGR00369 family)
VVTSPPARLFSFDLGFDTIPWERDGSGRLSPYFFAPGTDVVLCSVLLTLADNAVGSTVGQLRKPDISFTTSLSGGLVARPPLDAYRTVSEVLHNGRGLAVGESAFMAGDSVFATVQGSFVRSPNPAHKQPEVEYEHPGAGMLDRPLFEHCEITVKEPGVAVVELLPTLQNGSGLLHGGMHVVLAECAALSADPTPGRATLDMATTYLRGATVGPVRAVATGTTGATRGIWRYRVELRDTGMDDRLCSLSSVTVVDADLIG